MNSSAALKAFVGRHGGAVCTSTNARAVLEWAFRPKADGGAGGQKVLFFPDQHLGRNTGLAMGVHARRHAGLGSAARPGRAGRRPTSRTPPSCCGRATARCTSASGPSTSRPSASSTLTASSSSTPSAATTCAQLADQVGSTDFIIRAVAGRARRRRDRRRDRDPPREAARRRDAGQDDRVARPADLPVLDDVPHRRPAPLLGAGEPRRGRVVNRIMVDDATADWAEVALDRMLAIT